MVNIPERFQKTIQNITALEKSNRYLGALIFGSVARGDASEDSDLDVRVMVDQENDCENVNHLIISGNKVDITFRSFEQIKESVDEQIEKRKKKPWISDALILFDKTGKLAELKEEADKVSPKKLKQENYEEECRILGYSVYKSERFLEKDPETSLLVMHMRLGEALELHYKIHGRWWPSDKYLLNDLESWDSDLAKMVKSFLTESEVNKKHSYWVEIHEHIANPLGGLKPTYPNQCECENCKKDLTGIIS